ncbi:VENN motif pre-toxin domain-containing protein [Yersinia aldovae]|uniref:VENN motif pre-toxin domain-containing protein n=1 Tax=Yersinia aldovae TaxID=29483 RepID=UPI0021BDAB61|nr:VENN motif pre-toxin domain-containing protein [Yersinia aldovae]
MADIARTQGKIAEEKALKDPQAIQAAKDALAQSGNLTPTEKQLTEQIRNTAMAAYGTGSDLQRAIQAATAVTQGLTGGNLGQALAGGSAPYLAHEISQYLPADQNQSANLMAHAVLGAVVGHFNGNAAVGAAGAFTAEAAAPAIIKAMGWDKDKLTEQQKQTVSALGTLAAGLAGGLVGNSSNSAVAGMEAGKNAVENNSLSPGAGDIGFWLGNTPDCDTACKAGIAKGIAEGNLVVSAGVGAVAGGAMIVAATPEIAALAKNALEGCKAAPAICLNNAGLQVAEAVTPGGVGAAGAIGVGKTAVEATAAKAEAIAANAAKNISSGLGSKIDAGKFGQLELDILSQTGAKTDPAVKAGNLTVAGRALQKHGSREGSAFPIAKGTPAQMNEQGQKILDGIVKAPGATVKDGNRFGGFDVVAPDGRGARFDPQGNFRGFLEP